MEREWESMSRRSFRAQALEWLPPGQLVQSRTAPPCLAPHLWQFQGRLAGQLSVGRVNQRITALVMVASLQWWSSRASPVATEWGLPAEQA